MNDLASHLERLGLDQYLDAFIGEGFDTWDTLLDIQESDLESLNVKLGHRRKLQRAIADYRGIAYERVLGSPAGEVPSDPARHTETSQTQSGSKEATSAAPTETKRKYRRHPKADDNAPEKSPSAYVLFSNKVREEVKGENLSFTEIAKLAGDRWQKLDAAQKEPFESHANSLKESYNIQFAAYKKTDQYRDYCQYLEEFKAKHGPNAEAKRPKLGAQSSTGSASIASAASQEVTDLVATHRRVNSIESISTAPYAGSVQSPVSTVLTPVGSLPNLTSSMNWPVPNIPRTGSPSVTPYGIERRLFAPLSTQSSVSDDSGPSRSDTYDPLPRTATLSLNTPPTGTPPLPPHAIGSSRLEHSTTLDSFSWSSRMSQNAPQYSPTGPALHSSITLPSPTLAGDPWRERGAEAHRGLSTSGFMPSGSYTGTPHTPTILGSERVPDVLRSATQRTLPPLRQSSSIQSQFNHQAGLPVSGLFHHATAPTSQQSQETSSRPVNENEAASTLAGLAANRHGSISRDSTERRRPH